MLRPKPDSFDRSAVSARSPLGPDLSRTKEGERDHPQPIRAPVCRRTGSDDHAIHEAGAHLVAQPPKVLPVGVVDGRRGCAGFEIVAKRRLVEPYPKPTIGGPLDAGPELHIEPETPPRSVADEHHLAVGPVCHRLRYRRNPPAAGVPRPGPLAGGGRIAQRSHARWAPRSRPTVGRCPA